MHTARRALAAAELLLVAPAAAFVAALLLRAIPAPKDPANVFQQFVMLYADHRWTLWVLLLGLPLLVFVTGSLALLQAWADDSDLRRVVADLRAHTSVVLLAATTVTAAGTFAFIVLHMLAN